MFMINAYMYILKAAENGKKKKKFLRADLLRIPEKLLKQINP